MSRIKFIKGTAKMGTHPGTQTYYASPQDYLPVEILFRLLSALRWGSGAAPRYLSRQLVRFGPELKGRRQRVDFWIRLAQAAALLDEDEPPRPTQYALYWLSLPLEQQLRSLVEAWCQIPASYRLRKARQKLLDALLERRKITANQRKYLTSLECLGLISGDGLSDLGWVVLAEGFIESLENQPWQVLPVQAAKPGWILRVQFPAWWARLWTLEGCFTPYRRGLYRLDAYTLRRAAAQCASHPSGMEELLNAFRQACSQPLPVELVDLLRQPPPVKIYPGPLLEFNEARELIRLRADQALVKYLQVLLTNRHVLLDPWQAAEAIESLVQRGLLAEDTLHQLAWRSPGTQSLAGSSRSVSQANAVRLSQADREALLTLIMISYALPQPVQIPSQLFQRLSSGMKVELLSSAAQKAQAVLDALQKSHSAPPSAALAQAAAKIQLPEPRQLEPEALRQALEAAIELQETVEILYQKTGAHQAEVRRVTPLLIEERHRQLYLIAYCHNRRAQRTFRLDRTRLCT